MNPTRLQEAYRVQADADLATALSTEAGRRLLWQIIEGYVGSTFAGEETHRSAFLEGRRSIRVELADDCMRVSPSEYVLMLREAVDRRAEMALAESTDGG